MDEATGELGGSEPGAPDTWNFSIRVAKDWERAFFEKEIPGTRKIALRSAVTFSADKGGIFDVLSTPGTAWAGVDAKRAAVQKEQMVSWVHGEDFCRAVDFLIANELPGIDQLNNIASPHPMPNREFMRVLRQAWGVPLGLPAPAWLIEVGCFLLQTESELGAEKPECGFRAAGGSWVLDFCFRNWPTSSSSKV